jgi:hypothetical protein
VSPKEEVIGQILSDAIIPDPQYVTQNKALEQLIANYDKKKTYLLVIGGSQ